MIPGPRVADLPIRLRNSFLPGPDVPKSRPQPPSAMDQHHYVDGLRRRRRSVWWLDRAYLVILPIGSAPRCLCVNRISSTRPVPRATLVKGLSLDEAGMRVSLAIKRSRPARAHLHRAKRCRGHDSPPVLAASSIGILIASTMAHLLAKARRTADLDLTFGHSVTRSASLGTPPACLA